MTTFSRITTIFLLPLFLVLFSVTSVCGDPLYYDCDVNEGSIDYQTYMGMIFGTIYTQAAPFGYGFCRVQEVHGALLCRADVGPDDCENCFLQATEDIRYLCPGRLHAVLYSDYCYLLYTYKDTTWDGFIYYCSAGNIAVDLSFWEVQWNVFSQIALNAQNDPKYVSALYVDLGDSNTLYAYGQCHNQIDAVNCLHCLQSLRDWLVGGDTCAKGFVGGRLVAGSCVIRYELYPFLDA